MSYQVNYQRPEESRTQKDLDYMKELYPREARKYLKRISELLDHLDYEGSMIYDEYPDRWELYRLAESIVRILKTEAKQKDEVVSSEKWEWISDMVQVLLYHEIFSRRHGDTFKKTESGIYRGPYNKYY